MYANVEFVWVSEPKSFWEIKSPNTKWNVFPTWTNKASFGGWYLMGFKSAGNGFCQCYILDSHLTFSSWKIKLDQTQLNFFHKKCEESERVMGTIIHFMSQKEPSNTWWYFFPRSKTSWFLTRREHPTGL
jgi:hypothetical protein